jgi:hypothetical protein
MSFRASLPRAFIRSKEKADRIPREECRPESEATMLTRNTITATGRKPKWETVGQIGVDAGMVIVGDPCYFATPDCSHYPLAESWGEFCNLTNYDACGTTQLH